MATKLYLRAEAAEITSGAEDERLAALTPGSSLTVATKNTVTGPVAPITQMMTSTAGGTFMYWLSRRLNSVAISGTITFNLWMAESAIQANAGAEVTVVEVDEALTWIFQYVSSSEKGTEFGTGARAVQNWTIVPNPSTLEEGHRIAIFVWINDAGGTMASGRTVTLGYAGPTGGADGDSWVQFTETLTEMSYQPRDGFVDHANPGVF